MGGKGKNGFSAPRYYTIEGYQDTLRHIKTCFSSKSLAQTCVSSSCKKYIISVYSDILALKTIHEDLT